MAFCDVPGCGFATPEGERHCARHDGRRPSSQIVWLLRGRECVIEATGSGGRAFVRFLDTGIRDYDVLLSELRRPGVTPPRPKRVPRRGEAMEQVLGLLVVNGPSSVSALSRERDVSLQTTFRALARLEERGQVRRVARGVYEAVAA